jgi:alkylation response protein AidB-like acyl-CoA dehydrogenase
MNDLVADAPIFDPDQWRLTDQQVRLSTLARELGKSRFAERAVRYDREATFPTENFQDLHEAGLLGICIPESQGGHGACGQVRLQMI